MSDRYQIDHNDEKQMWQFQMDTLKIADDYAYARQQYSKNLKTLKMALAAAYGDHSIERKISEDKAYLVLAERDTVNSGALGNMIFYEGEYKGLEQILEARRGAVSFNQSLIKNRQEQT